MKPYTIRFTAKVLLIIMIYQLVMPATQSFALTTGPSQPEVQSFEPVGTTDMVDLFTGDFVYNIPLMDVEGYPINIAYHSGVNMEQEASWVGLGWNINPGDIGRGVRSIPDDFNGDSITKVMKIKPEKSWTYRSGITAEYLGGSINAGAGVGITFNNYKGTGVTIDASVSARLTKMPVSPQIGLDVSVGSQQGATVNGSAGISLATGRIINESSGNISLSASTGFNTRSGLRDIGIGTNFSLSGPKQNVGVGYSSSIPIGLQNYVSVVTNASTIASFSMQVKLGGEVWGGFPNFDATLGLSTVTYDSIGSRKAYGYLYAQNANDSAIMDFSREKDGIYNNTMSNLPLSSMTYDVYAISGQGTGGAFRPFRNDIGSVFDPTMSSSTDSKSVELEAGVGTGYEFGADLVNYETDIKSGPWFRRLFMKKTVGSLFENVYFKQAGEMTYSPVQDNGTIAGADPVAVDKNNKFLAKGGSVIATVPQYYGTLENRVARANYLTFLTNSEINTWGNVYNVAKKESYPRNIFLSTSATSGIVALPRAGSVANKAKAHHIGEISQILPDGRRYIYGIPAINNLQKEVTFAVDNANADTSRGLVKFSSEDDSRGNKQGADNYYQATYTPAYAHSYLLTSALSADYMDVTGDGLSEDDLGSYTKFNYTQTDTDYRWIAPIQAAASDNVPNAPNYAQYNPGFWSDLKDDKGNYILGSKEMWYMHSMESKNMVAEFYTSLRNDACGVNKKIVNDLDMKAGTYDAAMGLAKVGESRSYKLDSIKLYNKHDRILNGANAVAIKTVIFKYDYLLCPNVPNYKALEDNYLSGQDARGGKLTLRRIYFRYGNSDKSLLNPYEFNYSPVNKPYNFAEKDRWGNYKPAEAEITNYEFPYVNQDNRSIADNNASNWHLTGVKLPSGGTLNVTYEADDYSYVQDKRTMTMLRIAGVGSSTNYIPKAVLYENLETPYEYIYFERNNKELPNKTAKENYLQNDDLLYFSFSVDLASKNKYENIKGYAKVEDIGYCPPVNGSTKKYGYIKVKLESAGLKSNEKLNPVTLASLNIGRTYLPQLIYPGFKGNENNSALAILKGMAAAFGELHSIGENANKRFIEQSLSKKIRVNKSWIRLNVPGYTKIGGGVRVKTLKINDGWDKMAPDGLPAEYGQQYNYTTLLDNNTEISSGVASYEPLTGSDEIPQHRSANKYTNDAGRLMPAIEFNQEEPFGESFYPSPSVGYSKVTVTSIHKNEARSAKAMNVAEFYTAKDFPIETSFTEKSVPVNQKDVGLLNRFEEVNVLQGYVLRLNDMHGKTKAVSNYVIKGNYPNEPNELITSTKYNYQQKDGRLYNVVKAVKRGSLVRPTYSITDMVLGEETDFTIDNRMRENDSKNMNVNANLNAVGLGVFLIPIPTVFFPDAHEKTVFKSMVATKVIQQYGILKSVETIDHGARVLSENVLYDSETGEVLQTRVNNEFNDPITHVSLPAYWAYDNMGPSYFNTGYDEVIDSMYVDNLGKGYLMSPVDKRRYNVGDELIIKIYDGNAYTIKNVWVTGTAKAPGNDPCSDYSFAPPIPNNISFGHPERLIVNCGGAGPMPLRWWLYNGADLYYFNDYQWLTFQDPTLKNNLDNLKTERCNANSALVIEPRAIYPAGNSVPWIAINKKYKSVGVKVIRAGRRNMLNSSVQNVSIKGDADFASFISGTIAPPKVLNAAANTFTEDANADEFTLADPYKFNEYVLGKKGNFREYQQYGFYGARNYGLKHNRENGTISAYQNVWVDGTNDSVCSLSDIKIQFKGSSNWQLLKAVTQYSAYGLPMEEKDAAGIYSSAVYGYNHALPIAVGSNISAGRLRYFNFEDALQVQQKNRLTLGIYEVLKPITVAPVTKYRSGLQYNILTPEAFATGSIITTDQSHTGKYAMLFTSAGRLKLADIKNYQTSGGDRFCYASIWVKTTNGSQPDVNNIFITAVGKPGYPTASTNFRAFALKTNSIDGWYKLEGKLDMSLIAAFNEMHLAMPANYYIDDIRLYPNDGNMKSFAYDVSTMRLMAELDENNFATFYEYDQEGVLIRVKKESDRGILTVSENRKSNAKKVQ